RLTMHPAVTCVRALALTMQPALQLQAANRNPPILPYTTLFRSPSPAGATASNNTATTGTTGAATFSGLTLSGTVGNYTLSFGGTGLTPVGCGTIPMSASTAGTIAPDGGGTSAPAGTAVTPPPSVIVRDASGN